MPTGEEMLISAVLRTRSISTAQRYGIGVDHFDQLGDRWKWISMFHRRHGKTPRLSSYKSKYPSDRILKTKDVEHAVEVVLQDYARRESVRVINEALSGMEGDEPLAAITTLADQLDSISGSAEKPESFDVIGSWRDTYDDAKERIDVVAERGSAGILTGWDLLDDNTGGMQPGWLVTFSARLGQGKTWGMLRASFEAANSGGRVLYVSLEQSRNQMAYRFHSIASRFYAKNTINSLSLMKGDGYDLLDYKQLLESLEDDMPGEFIVNDSGRGRVGLPQVEAAINEHQPSVVFIDYVTLLKEASGFDWQNIAFVSSSLKIMAERYGIPIWIASQLRRSDGIGKEPPGPEALFGADAIGHDSDMLITMTRPSLHLAKLKNAKFRHGPDGYTWYCEFRPGQGIFDQISQDRADEIKESDLEID